MDGVVANTCVVSRAASDRSRLISGMLKSTTRCGSLCAGSFTVMLTSNVALNEGSSQHGNASRAPVASKWHEAAGPPSS